MAEMELEDWVRVGKLLAVGLAAVMAALGGTGWIETGANDDLEHQVSDEALWNARNELGEYVQQDLAEQAACDAALEAFSRHREDRRDWDHVLRACYSGDAQGIAAGMWDRPGAPAEDPHQ